MSTPPSTLSLSEKQALLQKVLMERMSRTRAAPASFAQERLWLLDRLDGASATYNVPAALRISGALDVSALERALGELLRRHEVLRTVFREEDGSPVQVISPHRGFTLPVEAVEAADAEEEVLRRVEEDARRPFDLSAGPLFRASLLRMGAEEHALLICMHHIVTDGWSMGVLFRELSALYGAFREGRPSPLPEPALQYADHAARQREQLRGEGLERLLAYWKERLAGAPALLEISTDHPRPAVQTYRGGHVPVDLPRALVERLEALARSEGATPYMVLLAAFQLLLGRYADSDDVVVGGSIAGRTRSDVEALAGFFVNTLVLRTDLSGDPSFRELVRRVRATTLGAWEHQEAPFEKLVEALQPERTLSHSPLFQASFDLQNPAGPDAGLPALPGLRVRTLEVAFDTTKFDLSLDLAPAAGGLAGGLTYAAELFERGTIERMAGHYRRVLEQVAADADVRLSRLTLAGVEERRQVVEEWNRTDHAFPRDRCVHELFEARAARTPEALALEWEGETLTYAALEARANRLAHHLAGLGMGPEARVGVLLERGAEMVVATLAVLKTGGCCVPVDTSYPPERMALMLADAGARILVTRGGLAAPPAGEDLAVVRLDEAADALAAAPSHAPRSGAVPENLAYVFYTSGSTGRPKGVMMGHREVVQFAACIPATMPMGPGDRVAQASNASFDAAVFEVWGALLNGASLVGIGRDVLLSAPALGRALRERGITHLYQTAALFSQHAREQADVYASLRQLVFGAEAVGTEGVRRVLREGRPTRVLHEYGPTEATVWCTLEEVDEVADGAATVSIGRPVPNARAYVLGAAGEPLPPGVPGELFIGGAGVVRGYRGRPGLTAERFVPDPFAAEPGARMYRTGDRARWRADGKLEFMGRLDEQVKMRGFRIEPGEVEGAIAAFPGVRQARVIVREDRPGDKRLVAYVVGTAAGDELRAHLRRSLPEYMVPQAFVAMDRLPLTPNGKLDRRALPAPSAEGGDERYVAPRTPLEEVLAGIWAEVLRLDRVGVHESFFDLGGHSLLATRAISRVRQLLGAELPLRVVFEAPTVAGVAKAVEEIRRAGAPIPPPVVPIDRAGPLPLSFAQERLWFLDRLEPGSPLYNLPAALRLSGALDVAALERALGEIVRRHEALRTVFAEVGGVPAQVVAPFAGVALAVEDLSGSGGGAEREAAAARRVAEEAARPFDLTAGPLFRATLLRVDDEEHVLVLAMHHAVSDGWSLGVLFRELSALYEADRAGGASPLPDLPVQYADHAAWQREHLRGAVLERQLAYWRERLDGARALLELPTDHPRPAARTFRGSHEPIELPRALLDRLEALGRREGATLFMVLLAAFQALLAKYAGSDDVSVGTPIAGRTRAEVEGLIGVFVNTLVLRTDLSRDPSFRALLGRVREGTLGAYEHQDVPFEKLVAELQPERSLGHSPLFQVLFVLETADDAPLPALPGLRVAEVETDVGTTKFDLTLFLASGPDGLRGGIGYSTDLFEAATVRRMAGHLERVLEQVAEDAELRLSAVELLAGAERARVLEEWNRTDAAYPRRCIHELVEARAARRPDAVAVVGDGEMVTYGELDRRANRLAHRLIALGVRAEDRVALFLEAGIHGIAGLLGIQKAGAAYVPLDVAAPDERTAFIVDESGAQVVVTKAEHAARPWVMGRQVVAMDDVIGFDGLPDASPAPRVGPESLAYVLYTSGSTGRPKGVLVEHGSVCNVAAAFAAVYRMEPEHRHLLLAPLHFDSSVAEMFATLVSGAALHVPRRDALLPGDEQVEQIRSERITHAKFTPSALAALPYADLPDLAVVAAGGEACSAELVARWRPGRRFVHTYGPTEATVRAAFHECGDEPGRPPLGRPIANERLYVLDPSLRPLPAGIPGELVVGGVPVTRGYLGRAALTAEKFVPDPFSGVPGARMYRTGDRGRWRADGVAEFIGRLDDQVKIRGFRVEPGEIRATLRRHPAVADCAVVAREDAPGRMRLVAYVVGAAGADALRAHLRESLPEYMVPAAFVFLDALPRNSNGKLDHRALPAPDYAPDAERHVAPRTPVEETLAAVWAEVLRLERVGVRENFFELGGDSILSIQVVSRARQAGVEITPRQMFEYQTVAELASVAGTRGGAAAVRGSAREPAGREAPLTPIQARFFESGLAVPSHHNQAVLLAVDPALSLDTLESALHAVLAHHDALRLRFRRADDGWAQRHAEDAGIALERIDLSHLPIDARDAAQGEIAGARQAGLDLEQGPLGRAVLFDRGEEGRILFLVFHHLVVDGVSWRILREDLERACGQVEQGDRIDLGARSTSFAAWAEALRAYAAGDRLRDEAAWWLARGAEGVAPLPLDGDRSAAGGARTVTVRLDEEETRALLQEAPAAYRTQVNDLLLCALAEALGGWAGGSRARITLEGHGREEEIGEGIDLTRTVGWFSSVYPVVLDLAGAAGPGDRLMAVKEQLRAIPGRGIGYAVLRYLGADEVRGALAARPEPEVAFNYLGQFDAGLAPAARLRFAEGPRGRDSAEENRRRAALDVNGMVEGGCLRLDWTYAGGTLRPETVGRVAESYLHALRGLVAHCREAGAGGYTPSDFPLAGVTQAELDAAVAGRRDVEDLYPLSPLQEGLLFHALYGGASQAYQVQSAHLLEGPLDVERFRRAWAEVAARHAVLRTAFVWQGLRRPLQRVSTTAVLPWRVEDWRSLSEDDQRAALERYLAEDRARGFALDEAPLLRCALFRVGDEAHWLVCSQHHLLMDRWSSSRVLDEVFRLYRGWSTGEAAELPRARPFRDYIGWLARHDPEAAERYWRGVLAGFSAPTPLGVDRPAGADAGSRHARLTVSLAGDRTRRMEEAARRGQVTINTLILGAWSLLLSRYGGRDDVVFGHVVAGRPAGLEGVEEMVGLFINTLPVRVRVPGDARAGAWLAALQRAQAEAREHEHAPLVQVQGWSEVPRGTPLFESLFVFANVGEDTAAGDEDAPLRIAESRGVEWTTYPLTLAAAIGDELVLSLAYDESRFDEPTIERMLEHLGRVLDGLAGDPEAPLSALDLAGDAERRLLLDEWNRTARPYPRGVSILDLLADQVRARPEAEALVWGDARLTYAEIDARANRLAHHLIRRGVGLESRVGVLLERGIDLIVSILAVLKAGGCYVPLDPAYPPERLGLMLADAGVGVLLTRGDARLDGMDFDGEMVRLDEAADALAAEPADAPRSGASPESLAYIVYTSGSTGRPKGVMVAHRHVVQLVCETDYVRLAPGDRIAQASNASFDALTFELFGALLNGATLVGIDRDLLLSPPALRAFLRENRITTLYQTTALLNQLTREQPDIFATLREVLFGGQASDADRVRALLRTGRPRRLLHMYGPTETTAWCSWEQVEQVDDDALTVSVGRATGNQRIYLLDPALQPVPIGVPGEAYVGGDGVVRGYLDRPALTAERFLPDPFAGEPGARMYRTGDRLRWKEVRKREGAEVREHDPSQDAAEAASTFALPHSRTFALVFVGRLDDQVKIRGFRIEPGEIESVLSSHPDVREGRVVVREDEPGEKRLVAYLVGDAEVDGVRAHLRRSLPEYMVPAAFVSLAHLPLTPAGKLDAKALPAPDLASPQERYVAPRTPVEEALAEIWADVLGVERAGAHDDFFALGGHSLLVIRAVSRIHEIFGFELPLRTLFENPTPAGLAALLTTDPRYAAGAERVAELMRQLREMEEADAAAAHAGGGR